LIFLFLYFPSVKADYFFIFIAKVVFIFNCTLNGMLADFIALLFPNICAACGKSLYKNEHSICTYCTYYLPKTNFHLDSYNPVAKIFWGRVPIHSAAAFYGFNKGGKVQHLIHQLKYKGQKHIGVTIGKLYGHELSYCDDFNTVTTVIPVPLHPKKQRKRGYNQSDYFAEGLAESMHVEADLKTLYRAHESESQTKKSRFNRWQNVESIFQLRNVETLAGKHVLLVDDVITTGATFEACAQTLLQVPDIKVSIAAIAYTGNQ
jgi:ComF family protein